MWYENSYLERCHFFQCLVNRLSVYDTVITELSNPKQKQQPFHAICLHSFANTFFAVHERFLRYHFMTVAQNSLEMFATLETL